MNILYYYSSQQIHTGSPKVLLRLIGGLDRDRFTPFFFSDKEGALTDLLKQSGVGIIQGKNGQISKNNILRNVFNIWSLVKILKTNSINLLHINELGWNFELVLAAWLCRIPIVFHIHNIENITRKNLNCLLGCAYLFVSKKLANLCDPEKILKSKSHILYNPINIEEYRSGKSIRHNLGLLPDDVIVGTVAQISKRKGIDIVLDVAEQILSQSINTKFIIVGPDAKGEETYAEEMRGRVVEKYLSDRIVFLGPRDDIANILASIDIFFLPTRNEPFGLVFVEAMAAGVPVIASNVGGIPEIIPNDKYGILLDPYKGDFTSSMSKLIDSFELRKQISGAAFDLAKENFAHSIFNKNIDQIYMSLVPSVLCG